jgi:hypothetical protein
MSTTTNLMTAVTDLDEHTQASEGALVKATPGPWKIEPSVHTGNLNIFGVKPGEEYHVGTFTAGTVKDKEIREANARLIAAAPEMLIALREALPLLVMLGDYIGNGDVSQDAPYGRRCRAILNVGDAIRKAVGPDSGIGQTIASCTRAEGGQS